MPRYLIHFAQESGSVRIRDANRLNNVDRARTVSEGDGNATLLIVRLMMEPTTLPEDALPEVLASEIEDVMKHWGEPQSSERQRFEEARREFQPCAEKIASAAAATERLDAKDFAFRINATR